MQCPQCDANLRLELDSRSDGQLVKPAVLRHFRIVDLLGLTALIALHLAAFPAEASTGGSDWAAFLYFTPTAVTCLLHLRLRLNITSAVVVHYFATAAWTFLHAIGLNIAINAHNTTDPDPLRDYRLEIYSNAWNDTITILGWGVLFAAVYGAICYTAVNSFAASNACTAAFKAQDGG